MNSRWFLEETTKDEGSYHSLIDIIHKRNSPYQRIEIIQTGSYGLTLVLDGKIQSTEVDEFIYHEALVHPAMSIIDNPNYILIAGGGEGATAREVLRYQCVQRIDLVDLDKDVVDVSIKYLDKWHAGAFNDPKVNLFFEDARLFINDKHDFYDCIIADLPEPFEGGPSLMLYTKTFYETVRDALNKDGVFITQATSSAVNNISAFVAITNTLKSVFPIVRPYIVNVPSFHTPWGFVLASKTFDPITISQDIIEKRLSPFINKLGFYDSNIHFSLFTLPRFVHEAIKKGKDYIITDSATLSFY
ncbi:MAG: polyamine aminopropyltransferase [Thermodesulfovibrionales bacterium]|nr:polyamine aminopropyltransferase [Thermodesulfovibrionales bacterium]